MHFQFNARCTRTPITKRALSCGVSRRLRPNGSNYRAPVTALRHGWHALLRLQADWHRLPIETGDVVITDKEAQFQLAYLYQEGLGGNIDLKEAQKIYQSLSDAGDPQGMYCFASVCLRVNALTDALIYFERSAQPGHISSAYWTAALYDGYAGYPRNEKKYEFFIHQAARMGHFFAKRDVARSEMKNAKNFFYGAQHSFIIFLPRQRDFLPPCVMPKIYVCGSKCAAQFANVRKLNI